MICSITKLDAEINFITTIHCNNVYPLDSLQSEIQNKISDFNKAKPASVERYPVYLHLPSLRSISDKYAKRFSLAVSKFSFSAKCGKTFFRRTLIVP